MKMKINTDVQRGLPFSLLLLLALCCSAPAQSAPAAPADLVLVVVVDQLRGDMPERFAERFGPGGFLYLMEQGAWFRNAQYQHASTMTAAGHAALATGGNAAQHGMIGNEWYDVEKQRFTNCVEDARFAVLGEAPGPTAGRSPRNLNSSTFGDELILAGAGRSRVFAVSIKDRAAIILGGHFGKAWWYSKVSGNFVTSSYYQDAYPQWALRWNSEHPVDRFANTNWSLLLPQDSYVFGDQDDRSYEQPEGTLGRTFPHPLPQRSGQALYSILPSTPMGDELTLAFVEALIAAEQPGRRGSTDVLAVSFSATDYIGHAFGPNSLEAEDNLLRLDRTLAKLFQVIDRAVGLDKTLVVLASDHGISPIPESLAERGMEAGRLDAPAFMKQINAALKSRFGLRENLARAFSKPGIYLDLETVSRLGLAVPEVERAVADEVQKVPGVAFALARSDLLMGGVPRTREVERVAAAFHPRRSGNVILVQDPFWYLDGTPDGNAAMHGAPYAYDTHVPLMFAGPGVPQLTVYREVAPRDVAPTLSAYLGISPPSGSVGNPLDEVLP
jgi:hypothetical protein